MNEPMFITVLLGLVATLFALLILILGWLGNKVYQKLVELVTSMHSVESDLHGKIGGLDRRVTVVETKISGVFQSINK